MAPQLPMTGVSAALRQSHHLIMVAVMWQRQALLLAAEQHRRQQQQPTPTTMELEGKFQFAWNKAYNVLLLGYMLVVVQYD